MVRKCCLVVALILVCSLFTGTAAYAGGWGPFFSWGRDWPKVGFPSLVTNEVVDDLPAELREAASVLLDQAAIDLSLDHYTVGVQYDSAPSRDKLFNFRIAIGFDFAADGSIESFTGFGATGNPDIDAVLQEGMDIANVVVGKTSSYGGTMQMSFGFSLVRTSLLKWWFGPGLRINGNYYEPGVPYVDHAATLEAGGGIDTGVNFHIGNFMSLCIAAGFHWNAFGLAGGTTGFDSGGFAWGNGPFCFVQTSALFHTGGDRKAW